MPVLASTFNGGAVRDKPSLKVGDRYHFAVVVFVAVVEADMNFIADSDQAPRVSACDHHIG